MNLRKLNQGEINVRFATGKNVLPSIFYGNFELARRFIGNFYRKYKIVSKESGKWNYANYCNYFNNRNQDDHLKNLNNEFYNNSLMKLNCHILVLLLLGKKIPLTLLSFFISAFEIKFFSDDQFFCIDSFEDFRKKVYKKFRDLDTNILVIQTLSGDFNLKHSMILFKAGNEIFYIGKHGFTGDIVVASFSKIFMRYFKPCSPYGNRFAFASYEEIFTNPEIDKKINEEIEKLKATILSLKQQGSDLSQNDLQGSL